MRWIIEQAGGGATASLGAWGRRGSWKRKKEKNQSNCLKNPGVDYRKRGQSQEGRVGSHGPGYSLQLGPVSRDNS
jgi:hypothetical protein